MKRIMAVCDADPYYADRFADFVNQKEQFPFTVMGFTTVDRLAEYAKNNRVELLLIDGGIDKKELERIPAGQIITLADGESQQPGSSYPSVYKYQSSDGIVREVMACYCEKPLDEPFSPTGSRAKILGVYSPVGRCSKTSLALAMGQLMAQDAKTLYINLEEFSGFSALMGEAFKGDLSDVLYYYKQGNYNWVRLNTVVYTWGSLDYIPPVRYPEDLNQMQPEEMSVFLEEMAGRTSYEALVVDMGQLGKRAAGVLDVCDIVYMPVREDCVSAAKIEEFDNYLELTQRGTLKEKIRKLKLPRDNHFGGRENYMEQLMWGELGDYVRQLLGGPFVWDK